MWDRATLKHRAKTELGYSYWQSFGVSATSFVAAPAVYGISMLIISILLAIFSYSGFMTLLFLLLFIVMSVALYIGISVLNVGSNLFYINAAKGDRQFSYMFLPFTSGKYMKIAGTMFMVGIRIMLWSMLFWIPGIIKMYQYRMVPYIIAENPDMSASEAIAISTAMTANDKFNIFVLDLSFIGWGLVASIAPGLGYVFLYPYLHATYTQLYEALKYKINITFDSNVSHTV